MNNIISNIILKYPFTSIYEVSNELDIPIYIGKTVSEIKERLKDHIRDKKLHHSCKIIELDRVPTSNYIFWETHYINLYKSWGFELLNKNNGGGGAITFYHTEETKQKQSQSGKVRKFTEICKRNMSLAKLGKKLTEKTRQRQSINMKGKNSIPVLQLDPITEELIKEWPSVTGAMKELYCDVSNYLRGEQKLAGDFKWKYKENNN